MAKSLNDQVKFVHSMTITIESPEVAKLRHILSSMFKDLEDEGCWISAISAATKRSSVSIIAVQAKVAKEIVTEEEVSHDDESVESAGVTALKE